MKVRIFFYLATLTILPAVQVSAQGTTFTYQGRLTDGANPANGSYDLASSLWTAASGPAQVGGTLTNLNTAVSNGLFTATLDFGNQFPGADRWIEIAVRTNGGGAFIPLSPRQKLTAIPYAVYAAGVNATGISGTLPSVQLAGSYGSALVFSNAANSFAGAFNGNGANLTNLNATNLTAGTMPDARLSSNVALRNTANTFTATQVINGNLGLGTNTPTARLHVNGQVRITGGSPGKGRILTSDADGTASWDAAKTSPQIVVVDAGGSGDYTSVSAALAAIVPTANSPYIIEVHPGLYFDRVSMKSHVHLKGAGARATVIMFNMAGAASNADLAVVKLNNLTNVTVSDLTLTTRGYTNAALNETCVGIYDIASSPIVTACRFVLLEGNRPTGSFPIDVFGVASSGSTPVIRNCQFESDTANDAVSLFQSSGLIAENSFSNHWHALYLTQSSAQFINNRLNGATEAVHINSTSEATVGFNHFTGTGSGATAVFNDGEARIVGNEITGQHEVGIENTGEAAILGNTITGCTMSGISDSSSVRTTISGNLLLNCSGVGQRALALINSSAVVVGNTFLGNSDGDIQIGGGATPTINNNRTTGAVGGSAIVAGYGPATIRTLTTSNLVLTADGGVGVGTGSANPVAALDVRGNTSLGDGFSVVTLNSSNTLNLQIGNNTNGALNGISFVENTSGFAMKLGYDGSGGGTENKIVIYDNANSPRFVFENGGNLGLGTNNPAFPVHHSSGAHLTAAGVWTSVSDRNAKENFEKINPRDVLAQVAQLPVSRWKYKAESSGTKHIGPMAQDFYAAFGLGSDDKSIGTVDADGVALAAIQGLNQKLEQKETEMAELKSRLEKLERLLLTQGPKEN